ncbi:MAG: hypothetical protein ABEJ87_03010, partial [Candidatus Nanohalobium sp.]
AAIAGGVLVYLASEKMGGRIGSRFKIMTAATSFLLLYGILTSVQSAGLTLFSYRDSAWSVVHIFVHLCFSTAALVGLASIRQVAGGEIE